MFVQTGRKLLLVKEKSKDIGSGKNTGDAFDDPFTATERDKPMMNYCDSHIL